MESSKQLKNVMTGTVWMAMAAPLYAKLNKAILAETIQVSSLARANPRILLLLAQFLKVYVM